MMVRLTSWLVFVFLIMFLPLNCEGEKRTLIEVTGTDSKIDEPSSYKKISLGQIWENPTQFLGQKIVVEGHYLGWKGKIKNPSITRSDWAIKDTTGAIYVTGAPAKGLDPMHDIGHPLKVWGTIRVNPEGVPYLAVEKVMVGQRE